MIETTTKYIQHTKFQLLENWSVQYLIESTFLYNPIYKLAKIGDFLIRSRNQVEIENGKSYQRVTIKINNGGVIPRDIEIGERIGTKLQYRTSEGQFLMSKIDARNGAFGIVPKELEGAVVTNDFPAFNVNRKVINPEFLVLITTTKEFVKFAQSCSSGTTNRQRIDVAAFLNVKIPLPTLEEQNQIVAAYNKRIAEAERLEKEAKQLEEGIEAYVFDVLGLKRANDKKDNRKFQITKFSILERWAVDYLKKVINSTQFLEGNFPVMALAELIDSFQYGLSEKSTKEKSGIPMLRMNNIQNSELDIKDLKYITIDEKTKEKYILNKGDLLFNRTNSKELVGKTAVFKEDGEYTFASYLIRVKLKPQLANVDFINLLFNSSILQYQKDMVSRKILGQANINSKEMQDFLFPVPPLDIQNSIVLKVKDFKDIIKQKLLYSEVQRQQAISEFESKIFMPCN